ncbi:MAG TPA: NAD(P)/FAD-dependent oxidoreductase [Steroidobacteraceae bacterium]|jgi:monoamine oxidase
MRVTADVLILGAGAAGLAAARVLAGSGRRVAVIEARRRIGGRIFTRHAASPFGGTIPVELGAEFIHGLPLESWRVIREAALQTYELDGSDLLFADGRLQPAPTEHSAATVLDDMSRWWSQQPYGSDETFAQYLGHAAVGERQRREAIRYVEGFNAADHRVIGVASLAAQQEAEARIATDRIFHVRAGYDAIPRFLQGRIEAAGGTLYLDKPVARIEWHAGAVTMSGIDSSGGDFQFVADKAVITLPLGVLHAGSVRFAPDPLHIIAEARRMEMGRVVRISLIFQSRFWRDKPTLEKSPTLARELDQLSFLFSDHGIPTTWWTSNPLETPILTGWIAGPLAALSGQEPVLDRCLNSLAGIFAVPAAALSDQLVSWHCHDWSTDPFARGAYSYVPCGALSASANIAEPVERTLYFAGEHTSVSGHWGTVHGALQSGEAAAAKVAMAP